MAVGVAWDMVYAQVTIQKLHEKDNVLWLVLGPFAVIGAASLLVAWRKVPMSWRPMAGRATGWLLRAVSVVAAALLVVLSVPPLREPALDIAARVPVAGGAVQRLYRLMAFHGTPYILAIGVGLLCAAWNRVPARAPLRVTLLGFGAVLGLFLVSGRVAPIYPWALRRYVIVAVPFIVLTQAYVLLRLVGSWRHIHMVWRGAACVLMGILVIDGARDCVAAMRVGDYRGLTAVVAELDACIGPDDVIVADDPRWGTPLLLACGRDVVNGKLIWESRSDETRSRLLAVLDRLRREEGRRVLWLTSTADALGIYHGDVAAGNVLLKGVPFSYPTVVHSARCETFVTRENRRVFSLYEWKSATSL